MGRRGVMADLVQVIEPFIPGLRRDARSLLKDGAAADDLLQDTLGACAQPMAPVAIGWRCANMVVYDPP